MKLNKRFLIKRITLRKVTRFLILGLTTRDEKRDASEPQFICTHATIFVLLLFCFVVSLFCGLEMSRELLRQAPLKPTAI
jgi:hypothetical protein